MNYKVCISNPSEHFVKFQVSIQNEKLENIQLQLPSWRPGRYELGNFAKNIRCFEVKDEEGKLLNFQKLTKDLWAIESEGIKQCVIEYEYYANQPDAGACYVSEDLLYLNPVNCLMYVTGKMGEPITVEIDVPNEWEIACQLECKNKILTAPNFDAIADSPFFASPSLYHHEFDLNTSKIHFWFHGGQLSDIAKLEADTRKYAEAQVAIFEEFPISDYHFLYLLLPDKFRHGVEHADSTVIAMGPAKEADSPAFYNDFLAISSHELFHLWNIKRMRPEELLPYDFTKENYSQLGYVYEGITTYYGDLMLFRSGVWSFEDLAKSFSADFDKHFNNEGRWNYSIAESSFDTWLDGYVPGVKGRKVSIYMEGLIAALIADIQILMATNGKFRLDEVLRRLYLESYKKKQGYSKASYKSLLEEVSGLSFDQYFSDLIDGKGKWDDYIDKYLNYIGLCIDKVQDEKGFVSCTIKKMELLNKEQAVLFDLWAKCS